MNIMLDSIYSDGCHDSDSVHSFLYRLLAERAPTESISHNDMPTFGQHVDFIKRKPYKGWYLVKATVNEDGIYTPIGSVYLSFRNEIGVAILSTYRRNGYGKAAIKLLMSMHSTEKFFLANINPDNAKSIMLFRDKLGFSIIQETYKLERKNDAVS